MVNKRPLTLFLSLLGFTALMCFPATFLILQNYKLVILLSHDVMPENIDKLERESFFLFLYLVSMSLSLAVFFTILVLRTETSFKARLEKIILEMVQTLKGERSRVEISNDDSTEVQALLVSCNTTLAEKYQASSKKNKAS